MSPLSHLRSVAALATRGGSRLPSRRNFSSSVADRVRNAIVEFACEEHSIKDAIGLWTYLSCGCLGFLAWEGFQTNFVVEEARRQVLRDLKNEE